MAYFFASSTGQPVAVNSIKLVDSEDNCLYMLSGVDCFEDFQRVVDCLRRNYADLSYKNGGQLVDLLRYRLATGTNDLTQELAHGRKIIFA